MLMSTITSCDVPAVLDALTLDQLRTFAAVIDHGSFSAAARERRRVQSAVSQAMQRLEATLELTLWDRSTRTPTPTDAARALRGAAERVLVELAALERLATSLAGGVEARVDLCVDALFPIDVLVGLGQRFAEAFPAVELRIDTQTLGAVSSRVADGRATLGVVGPMGARPELAAAPLGVVEMVTVVAPGHALAARAAPALVDAEALSAHVQIVLSERGDEAAPGADDGVPDQSVFSPRTWRVADLHTKHALLRAGLGFGNLPLHAARSDLEAGALVALAPAAWPTPTLPLRLSLVTRRDRAEGPAHRWVRAELTERCAAVLGAHAALRPGGPLPPAPAPRDRSRTRAGRARRSAGGRAR